MFLPSLWSKLEQSFDDIQLFNFIELILFVLFKTLKRSCYGVWERISENTDTTTSSQLQNFFKKVSSFVKIAI